MLNGTEAVCVCSGGFFADGLECKAIVTGAECDGVTCDGRGTCVVLSGMPNTPRCDCNADSMSAGATTCVARPVPDGGAGGGGGGPRFGCGGVNCGNGACSLTNGNVAYCECQAGFHAKGLTCVAGPACTPTVRFAGFAVEPTGPNSFVSLDPNSVLLSGNRVFRLINDRSVSIYNVADPRAPVLLSQITTGCNRGTNGRQGPWSVAEKAGYLYLGCSPPSTGAGFDAPPYIQVWDVRTPSSPSLVREVTGMGNKGLAARGNHLFGFGSAASSSTPPYAFVADISNPSNPVPGNPLGNTPVWDTGANVFAFSPGSYCTDLEVGSTTAYLACGRGTGGGFEGFKGLFVIDISNPASPTVIKRIYDGPVPYPKTLALRGSQLLMYSSNLPSSNFSEIQPTVTAIDVSNPAQPIVLERVSTNWAGGAPPFSGGGCGSLTDVAGAALLGCFTGSFGGGGVNYLISFAAPPLAASTLDLGCTNFFADGAAFDGTRLYVAGRYPGQPTCAGGASGEGLAVYDVTTCP